MDPEKSFEFTNGHFEWNNIINELQFVSHDIVHADVTPTVTTPQVEFIGDKYEIGFKDDIDLIDKIRFRRLYRRKVLLNDPKVILLQDVKDVAIFTANVKNLSVEFITFLHKPVVDRFFRALIIYFQFFFQTIEKLINRRYEKERKITQPIVNILENIVSDDLSDLRCMVAQEYFLILSGSDEASDYHHAQSSMSMSERDRRLCEMLMQFASRVVWVALNKPPLSLIEQECDRLGRSCHFNKHEHRHPNQAVAKTFSENERRILRGKFNFPQRRLNAMTPTGKEVMKGVHDHRMLAIGQVDVPPSDDRIRFLEKLYLLPEEEFAANRICIGILGMERDNFDVMLKPKRKKVHGAEDEIPTELIFTCEIPPRIEYGEDAVLWKYPITPPRIKIKERRALLKQQKKLWIHRIQTAQFDSTLRDFTLGSCASILL